MPPKKPGRPGTGKKTVRKPSARANSARTYGKTSPKTVAKSKNSKSMTPFYVLVIMGLLAAVVIMANNYRKTGKDDIKEKATAVRDETKYKDKTAERSKEVAADAGDAGKTREDIKPDKEKSDKAGIVKSDESAQKEYQIYLVRYNEKTEKMSLVPAKRRISSASPLAGALNELIRGPSKSEEKKGLLTAVPGDLKLRSVQVVGNSAVLDFNSVIEENANGEILLTRIDQLVYTATQFEGVENVVIKINGKQKKFLGGEGLSISGPIGRKNK